MDIAYLAMSALYHEVIKMWMTKLENGKFKYSDRYVDPYTEKLRSKSVTMTSNSAQARNKATKILSEKIAHALEVKTTEKVTFQEVYTRWYKARKRQLRPSSIKSYDSIGKIIEAKISSDILIKNIDTKYMQKVMDSLDYSDEYTSTIRSQFSQFFKYAKKMEYIDSNPMDDVETFHRAKTLDDYQKIGNKFLEKDEVDLLLKELYRRPSTYRLAHLAEFMYLTGTRIGEAVILKPSDIDFENQVVHITGTIDSTKGFKKATKGPTKTPKGTRDISLTNRCVELINEVIRENKYLALEDARYVDRGFLFTTKSGTPIQNNSFNLALKGAAERVGIYKNLSSHIFPHSHISMLAEMGIPLKAIMDRVGHADEDTTNQIYTHVTKEMKTNIIDKLEQYGF